MTAARSQRRLAAILAADVAGYSRLMGQLSRKATANLLIVSCPFPRGRSAVPLLFGEHTARSLKNSPF
jgi:hypothetical protein